MAGWATVATARVRRLSSELASMDGRITSDERSRIATELKAVRPTSARGPWNIIKEKFAGDAITATWSELHRIEEDIDQVNPVLAEVVEEARTHVRDHMSTTRLDELETDLTAADAAKKRIIATRAIRAAHLAAESRHETERATDRGIRLIAGLLALMAVLTLLLQAFVFDADRFVPAPSDGASLSAVGLLALIMIFGALGGAVSALVSLYLGSKRFINALWYDPRPTLTLMKVVLGAWTAVIGVLAVGSGLIVDNYTSVASGLLLAFMFGYGQQAVTTFLDRRIAERVDEETTGAPAA